MEAESYCGRCLGCGSVGIEKLGVETGRFGSGREGGCEGLLRNDGIRNK